MQRNCTPNNSTGFDSNGRQSHGENFAKVFNARKQPIRGLWVRNGRYYAQLKVEDRQTGLRKTRRILLVDKEARPVETATLAVAELERLRTQRGDNDLPVLLQNPKFAEYVASYFQFYESGQGAKRPATLAKEKSILKKWTAQLGDLRLGHINRHHVHTFMESRLKAGKSPRTVNLDVMALRNVLNRAVKEQRIPRLPTEGMRPFKTTTVRRPFFNTADLHKLCQAAFLTKRNLEGVDVPLTKNAQEFVDYVRLLAYCGARRTEALSLRWHDVDFQAEQLTIGALGDTKNRTPRVVDFNPKLKLHLLDMRRRRAPDCQWLFPSPQRGRRDIAVKTFRESLDLVRQKAELPAFQFHDCRHHFISMCVMSGVDFMTIAAWVGHRDGGVLIGKVYGHLANEHRKRMAGQVAFDPTVLAAPAAA
jgi:integrase